MILFVFVGLLISNSMVSMLVVVVLGIGICFINFPIMKEILSIISRYSFKWMKR